MADVMNYLTTANLAENAVPLFQLANVDFTIGDVRTFDITDCRAIANYHYVDRESRIWLMNHGKTQDLLVRDTINDRNIVKILDDCVDSEYWVFIVDDLGAIQFLRYRSSSADEGSSLEIKSDTDKEQIIVDFSTTTITNAEIIDITYNRDTVENPQLESVGIDEIANIYSTVKNDRTTSSDVGDEIIKRIRNQRKVPLFAVTTDNDVTRYDLTIDPENVTVDVIPMKFPGKAQKIYSTYWSVSEGDAYGVIYVLDVHGKLFSYGKNALQTVPGFSTSSELDKVLDAISIFEERQNPGKGLYQGLSSEEPKFQCYTSFIPIVDIAPVYGPHGILLLTDDGKVRYQGKLPKSLYEYLKHTAAIMWLQDRVSPESPDAIYTVQLPFTIKVKFMYVHHTELTLDDLIRSDDIHEQYCYSGHVAGVSEHGEIQIVELNYHQVPKLRTFEDNLPPCIMLPGMNLEQRAAIAVREPEIDTTDSKLSDGSSDSEE